MAGNTPRGRIVWYENFTHNGKKSLDFYTKLFGWEFNDSEMGPGQYYTMLKNQGRDLGALYAQKKEERAQGIPPHWNSYVTVANADQSAAKAKSLGGTILAPPFDVSCFFSLPSLFMIISSMREGMTRLRDRRSL